MTRNSLSSKVMSGHVAFSFKLNNATGNDEVKGHSEITVCLKILLEDSSPVLVLPSALSTGWMAFRPSLF